MTVHKLLGLLFEHVESDELFWFKVNDFEIELKTNEEKFFTIDLNQDLLTQYNKIFNYE